MKLDKLEMEEDKRHEKKIMQRVVCVCVLVLNYGFQLLAQCFLFCLDAHLVITETNN